jgi:FKBP-type peptidyl-prolyl cis-trans isomerase 2
VIKEGSVVTLHYTGKLEDGTVFDSSEGKDPLTFTVGGKQVIPGFEKGVIGMQKGEKKTIHVVKEDAYEYHAELVQTVPRAAAPKELELQEGMTLALRAPTGQVIPARVTKLTEENITIDLNPPIAGKDLTFDIEIVQVDEA